MFTYAPKGERVHYYLRYIYAAFYRICSHLSGCYATLPRKERLLIFEPHSFLDSGGALRDTPKDGWEGHYLPRDNLEKKSKPACRELINWTRVKHYAFCFNPCL